ncbi:MAG: hypothetical protein KJO79_08075, partial [Verrucomicrobiae bacterium]|nr:hypothetical protein [Verrucomicrobiae bacterium]NNJ87122.1 hypothetical protein [Akkermansiaceae bacterium]
GKGTALDLFKSSSRTHSTTGTLLTYIPKNKISNWAKAAKAPTVSIDGNTKNPSGKIILCVDFVPRPRIPVGRILLNGNTPRNGEKIAVTWKIYR